MNRRTFMARCGLACTGGVAIAPLLDACAGHLATVGEIDGSDLVVPAGVFTDRHGDRVSFAEYVIVRNDQLRYPVCVYRLSADRYAALWMRCTHQGTELEAFGGKLQCPAHGSEFSNTGQVLNGPAVLPLRTFPVTRVGEDLRVSLRAEGPPS